MAKSPATFRSGEELILPVVILYLYFRILLGISRILAWFLRSIGRNTQETVEALWPFRVALGGLHRIGFAVKAQGVRFIYRSKDLMNLKIVLVGAHEYEVTDFIHHNLCPSDIFLDVGANIGYYTLIAAKMSPQGRVVAIEPSVVNASMLKENIRLNGAGNVTIVHRAAWQKSGVCLALHIRDPYNFGANSFLGGGVVECQVETIAIDDLIAEQDLTRVDLVKIDVEGAEYEVLLGMSNCLQTKPPRYIVCALDHPDEINRQHTYELLRVAGYEELDFVRRAAVVRDAIPRATMLFRSKVGK